MLELTAPREDNVKEANEMKRNKIPRSSGRVQKKRVENKVYIDQVGYRGIVATSLNKTFISFGLTRNRENKTFKKYICKRSKVTVDRETEKINWKIIFKF